MLVVFFQVSGRLEENEFHECDLMMFIH